MLRSTLAIAATLAVSSVHALELDLDLNDDAVKVGLATKISPSAMVHGDYHHDQNEGNMGSIGISTVHQNGIHNFGIGAKMVGFWAKHRDDAQALALGGQYKAVLSPKFSISANGYYSPSVLTSSKLDGYYEYDLRAAYLIMPNADLHIGYKDRYFDYKSQGNLHFDQGFYLGAAIRF